MCMYVYVCMYVCTIRRAGRHTSMSSSSLYNLDLVDVYVCVCLYVCTIRRAGRHTSMSSSSLYNLDLVDVYVCVCLYVCTIRRAGRHTSMSSSSLYNLDLVDVNEFSAHRLQSRNSKYFSTVVIRSSHNSVINHSRRSWRLFNIYLYLLLLEPCGA